MWNMQTLKKKQYLQPEKSSIPPTSPLKSSFVQVIQMRGLR